MMLLHLILLSVAHSSFPRFVFVQSVTWFDHVVNTFIRHVGKSAHKINNKQYTYIQKKKKDSQSVSNLTCNTDLK